MGPAHITNCNENIQFNLSHSGDAIICVLSADNSIGVDTECTTRQRSFNNIAYNYFSPAEQEALIAAPELSQLFYQLWTLKESLIKAQRMSITQKNMQTQFIASETQNNQSPWHAYSFLIDDYQYAICSAQALNKTLRIESFNITLTELQLLQINCEKFIPQTTFT
ncbi:MAG: 4'-phosphopantetheinyl transferase superfamily protein [Planctomycetes bacterium]|nr:4'-phosphopantetheinyl transferase superfamily protein [Planctomycetota bacterium]